MYRATLAPLSAGCYLRFRLEVTFRNVLESGILHQWPGKTRFHDMCKICVTIESAYKICVFLFSYTVFEQKICNIKPVGLRQSYFKIHIVFPTDKYSRKELAAQSIYLLLKIPPCQKKNKTIKSNQESQICSIMGDLAFLY